MNVIAKVQLEEEQFEEFKELYENCDVVNPVTNLIRIRNGVILKSMNRWMLVPQWLSEYKPYFFIEGREIGGAEENGNGNATVVCNVSGEKMLPYYVNLKEDVPPNGVHAWFTVPKHLIEINSVVKDEKEFVIITYNDLLFESCGNYRFVWVREKQTWSGPKQFMPKFLQHFDEAVDAACKKAKHQYCTVHYFALQKDNLPERKKPWNNTLEEEMKKGEEDSEEMQEEVAEEEIEVS